MIPGICGPGVTSRRAWAVEKMTDLMLLRIFHHLGRKRKAERGEKQEKLYTAAWRGRKKKSEYLQPELLFCRGFSSQSCFRWSTFESPSAVAPRAGEQRERISSAIPTAIPQGFWENCLSSLCFGSLCLGSFCFIFYPLSFGSSCTS